MLLAFVCLGEGGKGEWPLLNLTDTSITAGQIKRKRNGNIIFSQNNSHTDCSIFLNT